MDFACITFRYLRQSFGWHNMKAQSIPNGVGCLHLNGPLSFVLAKAYNEYAYNDNDY